MPVKARYKVGLVLGQLLRPRCRHSEEGEHGVPARHRPKEDQVQRVLEAGGGLKG